MTMAEAAAMTRPATIRRRTLHCRPVRSGTGPDSNGSWRRTPPPGDPTSFDRGDARRPARGLHGGMSPDTPPRVLVVANLTASTPALLEEVQRRAGFGARFALMIPPPDHNASDWSPG